MVLVWYSTVPSAPSVTPTRRAEFELPGEGGAARRADGVSRLHLAGETGRRDENDVRNVGGGAVIVFRGRGHGGALPGLRGVAAVQGALVLGRQRKLHVGEPPSP